MTSSTQPQFENVSPVPPPTSSKQPTTSQEPSRLVQTIDTSFMNSEASLSTTLPSAHFTNMYGASMSATGIPLVTVGSYMTNLHYQGSQGVPMSSIYGQGYGTTQGLAQPIQYQTTPQPTGYVAHPPLPTASNNMYSMPPSNLQGVQHQPGFGMSPGRGVGQSPLRPLPPPLPPSQMLNMPAGHSHSRAEFTWPRQFGVPPPNQPPARGGWMPR